MKSLRIITLLTFVMLAFAISAAAQVTVTNPGNTTPGLAASYGDLATAITDLNAQTAISGPVTITLDPANPQTAPSGGYAITASLAGASATNTVTIAGSANTITAPITHTVGALNDGIFKIIGSDFITISGFTMVENPANIVTAAATNTMTEWGVALLYASTTNGAQNITITGNTIDLNRTYQNTFGIYSNSTHSATTVTTSATATTTAGGNSGLTITANNITDVNNGIVVVGPLGAADYNDPVTIGGTAPNANTLTNYGTTGTFSGYANVSGTVNGILVRNTKNATVSFNSITSSVGGVTAGTLNGIQFPAFSVAPTGTFTQNVNNNTVSLQSGLIAGAMNGINILGTTASVTSIINVNNNNFANFGHTVAGTGAIIFITQAGTHLTQSISNNTFTNMTVNTTSSVTFISNGNSLPAGGTKNVNNNSIVTGFSKTGAGGTVTGFVDAGGSPAGATNNSNNNNFSNVTIIGTTIFQGINNNDGGAPNRNVTGNTVSNITGGTGSITGILTSFDGGTITVSGNTVSNLNGAGVVTGMTHGSGAGLRSITQNTVHTLTGSGTGTVTGIVNSATTTLSSTLSRNKVYGISNTNAGGAASGITVSGGTTINVQNNLVGDITTPNANAAIPLTGINVSGGTTVTVDFNSVYLNATSAGALFGSAAINVSTTPNVTLRSNIFVNLSTPTGAGETVAYRRTTATLASYAAASNGNLFYAGTPSATNLIFTDTVTDHSTLAGYKALASPRDSTSVTENPPFLSTTGSSAMFLHISAVIATQVESGGVSVGGITLDFDGDARAGTPDIGADEFIGIPIDLVGPAISYTAFANTALLANRPLTVTITDASGVAGGALAPRIYFRKNAGAYFSTQCTGASPTYTCTIDYSLVGGSAVADVIDYFVVAQDTAGNVSINPSAGAVATDVNTVTTPPTTPNTYTIIAAFLSTVSVPGDFPSLTNVGGLFEAMNAGAFTGNTVVNITASLAGETGAVALNQLAEEGAGAGTYTVLIKPMSAGLTISGIAPIAVIRLNGADRVRIDGSTAASVVGGTPALRELTIQNLSTSTTSGVIHIGSATGSSNTNTVRNLIVLGNDPLQTITGISTGGATPTSTAAFVNNNNRIENNSIQRVQVGIFTRGVSQATLNTGTVITENDLSATGLNRVRQFGIFVGNEDGIQINQNSIGGIDTLDVGGDTFGIAAGIGAISTSTTTTTFGVTNAVIARNKINGVKQDATFSAAGIAVAGIAGTNRIANNMITGVISDGNAGDIPAGIFVTGVTGTTTRLYYNAVSMTGDRNLLLTPGATQEPSYGIAISGTDPIVEMKNNIFYTTQLADLGTSPNAFSFAIGMTTTTFANLDSNYNDFWSTGVNDGGFRSGSLTGGLGTGYATLALWNGATGDDPIATSLEVDPLFVSDLNDLHLSGIASPMYDKGIAITSPIAITDDFDGQTRSLVGFAGGVPDIGGDEALAPLAAEGSISGRVMAADGVGIRNSVITVTGGNLTEPRVVRTSAFGYYSIDGLELGSTYVVTVRSKRFVFENQSVIVTLQENVGDLDFQAIP